MKKILFYLCFLSSLAGVMGISKHPIKVRAEDKIIFEGKEKLSLDTCDDVVDNEVSIRIKLNYARYNVDFDSYSSRAQLIQAGKKYHTTNNTKVLKNLDLSKYTDVFVDNYTPFVTITTKLKDSAELLSIAESSAVKEVVVSEKYEVKEHLTQALSDINAKEYIDNSTYTGKDVVVGLLESGVVNVNHASVSGANITVKSGASATDHATSMAAIIYQMAPDVTIYSAAVGSNIATGIDWLLDNNVSIINMSYGEAYPSGNYSADSAYCDYLATHYRVLVIAAAGNDTINVCNPGLAYNGICVGASAYGSTGVADFSAYQVNNGAMKPNIIAPGEYIGLTGSDKLHSGTSVSTAIVTGCAALLIDSDVFLDDCPERLMALLYASADLPTGNFGSGLLDSAGAGRINFKKALESRDNNIWRHVTFTKKFNFSCKVNLNAGDTITSALVWLVDTDGSVSSLKFTNFDLYLKNPQGEILTQSTYTDENVERVQYKVTETGQYSLYLKQEGTQARQDLLSLYYTIE